MHEIHSQLHWVSQQVRNTARTSQAQQKEPEASIIFGPLKKRLGAAKPQHPEADNIIQKAGKARRIASQLILVLKCLLQLQHQSSRYKGAL